ncbi:c-type cytochrome [Verticiella sediminum]|uniref:C-type cytochrome n=1 Tax=Verticiella sediminum TaxID=1247510 RepID=A0A556A6F4_9BURK|nr:c-type cytochrome [Verticiella sediminum]TSH88475.1 c-type cytochrome [Verticiella sediminum]
MKRQLLALAGIALSTAALTAQAADLAAGRAVFEKFNCASCHGADAKTSVDPSYPILAGQHADYLAHALRAYQRGQAGLPASANVRRNAVMGAFAVQLSPQDIDNVAAWLASLPSDLGTRR